MSNLQIFPLEYSVVRSKRKTLCVSIDGNGITVKAPCGVSVERIEKFLFDKQKWIEKKLADQCLKSELFKDIIDCNCVMYHGKLLEIQRDSNCKRANMSDGVLHVPERFVSKTDLNQAVGTWGKRTAKRELKTALDNLSARTGLKYNGFMLTNAKTKWGSCDGDCNIMLNWRLIMLDNELVTYVIVHELTHTVHHNHSKAFWSEVKKRLPDCDIIKKRLKTFSLLTTLYR